MLEKIMYATWNPLAIQESGLTLMLGKSYLGASTDGHICDLNSIGKGILEIKCPFQIQGEWITHLSPREIVEKFGNDFYCISQGGNLSLKQNSNYFYQVQGEMCVTGADWCDFVVWTEAKGVFKNINLHWKDRVWLFFLEK